VADRIDLFVTKPGQAPGFFVRRFLPPSDFFGFFGALKKGDFFGLHPKKVFFNNDRDSVPSSLLDTSVFRTSVWRLVYIELIMPKRERRALRPQAESLGPREQGGLFWGGPQKTPKWRPP
jgi:hypothetical protein